MVHVILICAMICMTPILNKKYPTKSFAFPILFLFMALRYDYGNDYMGYFSIHTLLNAGLPAHGGSDILFKFLNISIKNYNMFIAITSLIYITVIWHFIKHNLTLKNYWFAWLLLLFNPYLFLMHLSTIRQTIAMCFFIIAINFAIKRKIVLYILFILLASGMHLSSIILLPLYPLLTNKPFTKKSFVITLSIVSLLLLSPVFNIIVNYTLSYMPIHYKTVYYDQNLQNSLRSTIISSFYFFLILFNLHKLKGKEIIYGKLSLIATIISLLAFRVAMISRIGLYFDIFLIITIPQIFTLINNKNHKQILFIILIGIYLLRYYSFFTNPLWENFREYQTIL